MGYILPINHYQYKDYQTRVNHVKRIGAKSVERPFKVILEKHHEDVRSEHQRLQEDSYPTSPKNMPHGKGQNFHAIV